MSFILKNSFLNHDDDFQPYSIEVEKDNLYYHLNGKSDKNGYAITFSGARAYIDVPEVKTFNLKLNLLHYQNHAKGYNETFAVLFGYNRRLRNGYQIEIVHVESGSTKIRLVKKVGKDTEVVKEQDYSFYQECDRKYPLALSVLKDKVICDFAGCVFECEVETEKGKVALLRENGFLEIYLTDLEFSSEEIVETKVGEYDFTIPNYNGIHEPYVLNLKLFSLGEGIVKIDYEFKEGLFKKGLKSVGASWAMLYEEFNSIYFKINDSKRYYLNNEDVRLFEENTTPKHLGMYAVKESVCDLHKALVGTWREPKKGSITVKAFGEVETVTFGYKNVRCFWSEFYASPMQFIFDKNGKELYIGAPIDEEVSVMVKSPLYQSLSSLIPSNAYKRDRLIKYFEDNHYFLTDDKKIEFFIDVRSKFNLEDITIKAYLQDAFYNNVKELSINKLDKPHKYDTFDGNGYLVELEGQKLGVYHLFVEVYYLSEKISEHRSAFEVIDRDSDVSPQKASGIITAHVGDSGRKQCPDFWGLNPDNNYDHYVDILLIPPQDANERRVWEIYPIFKRKITCWMNQRCAPEEDLLENKDLEYEITKHADYLYYQTPGDEEGKLYHRYDFYVYRHVKSHMLNMLDSFLKENEDVQKDLQFKNVKEEFTLQNYEALMTKYSTRFINYCVPKIDEMYISQFEKVKEVNPKAKRFSYGPLSIYVCSYASARTCRLQGHDPKRLHEVCDGYWQFEDYPLDCNYSTTKAAYFLSTLNFVNDKVRIFPELYDTWLEGCPDEALPGAHPPLGYYYCEPYACMTQIFEYVYNTANYKANKKDYDYWRDYALMLYNLYVIDVKAKFDEYMPAWGLALKNLPKKPLKGSVFLYEIPDEDDRFNTDASWDYFKGGDYGYLGRPVHNISDTGEAYVYRIMRESGVPVNSITNFEGLDNFDNSNLDILVIPSLKGVSQKVKDKIRSLYEKGTPIIAVSEVEGLEDIFGVKLNRHRTNLTYLNRGEDIEYIAPIDTEVYYDAVDSEVLLQGDDKEPIILRKGNALLINAPIGEVGIETLKYAAFVGAYNISLHIENILTEEIRNMTTNEFKASKRCGLTPFVNEKGEDVLLLIDYSKDLDGVDYKEGRIVDVELPCGYKDVEGIYRGENIGKKYVNGNLTKISLKLRRQQSALIKLIK